MNTFQIKTRKQESIWCYESVLAILILTKECKSHPLENHYAFKKKSQNSMLTKESLCYVKKKSQNIASRIHFWEYSKQCMGLLLQTAVQVWNKFILCKLSSSCFKLFGKRLCYFNGQTVADILPLNFEYFDHNSQICNKMQKSNRSK